MPTVDAEAVVLRQYSLSDADRIVVLFSRDHGKIRAVAKGAKKPKSRLGGCLEPLNQVRICYYLKEGAELGRIFSCETIHSFLGRTKSLENICAFQYFSEIINEMVEYGNPNLLLYRLFAACLKVGESVGANLALVRYFEIWSLKLSGLLPDYGSCSRCGKCAKEDGLYAWPESGEGRCDACAGGRGIRLRPEAITAMRGILELPPDKFASGPLAASAGKDLENLAQKHFDWQLEKKLKSYPALKEVFRDVHA